MRIGECIIQQEATEMDERALIINAIKQKKDNTPEVDFDFPEPDVLTKWAKKKKQQESFKRKTTEEWTNADFLRYLDFMLKDFGVARSLENMRRDSDKINLLHDKLAKQLEVDMSNVILKEYLEWWCSIWAPRLTGSEFHLNLLIQDYQINRFASRYQQEAPVQSVAVTGTPVSPSTINDDNIYDLGGINLLLVKRGIVVGYRMLRKRGISNADKVLKQAIEKLSEEVLVRVLKTTLRESPYPLADQVDFVSVASSAINRFGLSEYTQLNHRAFFKE